MADTSPDLLLHTRLKARQLALLVALHERGSLRQAAADVAISQPAATKMLQDLEHAFGVQLFERHGWGMVSTLYGDTVARYARGILNDVRQAREEVAALVAGARGNLRVGAVTGAVPSLLVPALRTVQANAPDLRIFVLVNATEVLANALRDGTLEVAIGPPMPPLQSADLLTEVIARERLCVVARRHHPLATARRLKWRDIDGASWILQPRESALRQSMDALFTRLRIAPGPALVETVSIVATLALLQTMDALSVLPLDLARHYERDGVLIRLSLPAPGGTEYALMHRADRQLSPAARDFTGALRKVVTDNAKHAKSGDAPAAGRRSRRAAQT